MFHFINIVQVLMVCVRSTMQAVKFFLNKEYFLWSTIRQIFCLSLLLLMYFDVPFSSRVFLTCPFFVAISRLGSISAVSRVQSLIFPEERRLDAWPVDLVCDVIGKLIIQASSMSLEVKPVSKFLIYLAPNCIKRSLTHQMAFEIAFLVHFHT